MLHKTSKVVPSVEGQFSCATKPVLATVQSENLTSDICTMIKIIDEELQSAPNQSSSFVGGHFGEFFEQVIHHDRMPHINFIMHVLERRRHCVHIIDMKLLSVTTDSVCPSIKRFHLTLTERFLRRPQVNDFFHLRKTT